jgi:hypothetical protein
MRELESRLPPKRHLSTELHRALQLLASNPRGSTEHMLVLGHGFSSKCYHFSRLSTPKGANFLALRAHLLDEWLFA